MDHALRLYRCLSFRWEVREFGACSESCKTTTSVRSRLVICRQQQGDGQFVTVDDSVCEREDTRQKPHSTESCGADCAEFSWHDGPWSSCSVQCGDGTQTRTVLCLKTTAITQLRVPDSECITRFRWKPPEQRRCDPIPRCRYNLTRWSECSVTCGHGMQTRVSFCVKIDADFLQIIDNEHCDNDASLLKPYTSRDCYTGECPCVGPRWVPKPWSPCTRTCGGGGTQQRDARCRCIVRGQLQEVQDETCDRSLRPPLTQQCGEIDCPCLNPRWHRGWWDQCPVTCGEGTERRNVSCICTQDGNVKFSPERRCLFHPRPRSQRACYRPPCPCENPAWGAGTWSACSKPCNGRRSRTVTCNCEVASRYQVEDDVCFLYLRMRNESRPIEEESCGGPCQCENYRYKTSEKWSHCSKTCGIGERTRVVTCWCDIDGVRKRRDMQECVANIGRSPRAVEPCNSTCSCAGRYVTGSWTPCLEPCGGKRVRNVTCRCLNDEEYSVLTDESCALTRRPYNMEDCAPCEYRWSNTSWKPVRSRYSLS